MYNFFKITLLAVTVFSLKGMEIPTDKYESTAQESKLLAYAQKMELIMKKIEECKAIDADLKAKINEQKSLDPDYKPSQEATSLLIGNIIRLMEYEKAAKKLKPYSLT